MKIFVESVELYGLTVGNAPKMTVRGRDENLRDGVDISMPLNEEQARFLQERLGQLVNVEVTFSEVKK